MSLLTDAATEAVYPLLPVFITQVLGGPPIALGIIEGAADATSSALKVVYKADAIVKELVASAASAGH